MLSWAPGCSEDRLSPPQLVCGLTSKILAYHSPFPAAGQPQLELPYFANRKAWPWIKTSFSEEPSLRRLPEPWESGGLPRELGRCLCALLKVRRSRSARFLPPRRLQPGAEAEPASAPGRGRAAGAAGAFVPGPWGAPSHVREMAAASR